MTVTIKAAYITGAFILIGAVVTAWVTNGGGSMSMNGSDQSVLAKVSGSSNSIHIGDINNPAVENLNLEEIKELGIKEHAINQFLEDMGVDKNTSASEINSALLTIKQNFIELKKTISDFQERAKISEIPTPNINTMIINGSFDDAEKALKKFVEDNTQKSTLHILSAAQASALNASIAESRFQYHKAHKYLKQAYSSTRKLGDKYIKVWATYLVDIGRIQQHLGSDDAISTLEKALKEQQRVFGVNSPEIINCLGCMALAYAAKENYGKAESLSKLALDIAKQKHGKIHEDTAYGYFVVGRVQMAKGEYSRALASLKLALEIANKVEKKNTKLHVHRVLSGLYSHIGNDKLALNHMESAYELHRIVSPQDAPQSAKLLVNLGVLHRNLGSKGQYDRFMNKSKNLALEKGEDNHFVQKHMETIEYYDNYQCTP